MPGRVALTVGVALACGAPASLLAQTVTAAGRVVRPRAADTVPVPGVRVMLHRVGGGAEGPVDSTAADAGGRFRFRFRPDSAGLYLLSARYGDIEYFSPPVRATATQPDTSLRLIVYDTSSTAPIGLAARHIVVPRPGPDGTRSVLDLIVLENEGRIARVAPDSAHPSWRLVLPRGAVGMEVGESDVSPEAVVRVGDTVAVLAPIAPGQKQLSLEYGVFPVQGRLAFPVGPAGGPVNLLVEEPGVRVSGGTLALADSQVIEGRSFRRWTGEMPAGGTVVLAVGEAAAGAGSRRALRLLVGAVVLVLAAAAWRLLRRRAAAPSAERLLDVLAALDARYEGRQAELPTQEWQRYEAERARLKRELDAALAARGRHP